MSTATEGKVTGLETGREPRCDVSEIAGIKTVCGGDRSDDQDWSLKYIHTCLRAWYIRIGCKGALFGQENLRSTIASTVYPEL